MPPFPAVLTVGFALVFLALRSAASVADAGRFLAGLVYLGQGLPSPGFAGGAVGPVVAKETAAVAALVAQNAFATDDVVVTGDFGGERGAFLPFSG